MPLPEVRLSSKSVTVGHWTRDGLEEDGESIFDLDAPYQRGSVWTVAQRRYLIKSLYMGIPVGSIVVSVLPVDPNSPYHYRVVDGKQRVETVRSFVKDGFSIPREWLRDEDIDESTEGLEEVYFSQLTPIFPRHFQNATQLPVLEFDGRDELLGRLPEGGWQRRRRTAAELLQAEAEIYGLINFAGTEQTQEDKVRAERIAKGE